MLSFSRLLAQCNAELSLVNPSQDWDGGGRLHLHPISIEPGVVRGKEWRMTYEFRYLLNSI